MTTSFKTAVNVTQGHLIPFVDFTPDWKGWRSLGLSPDTIFEQSTVRDEFIRRFFHSIVASAGASILAVVKAAKTLADVFPEVVVTAGGAGVAFANRQGDEILVEALKVDVNSTHGAGDEFIGVLSAELATGAA